MPTISERLREGRTNGTALRWQVTDVHIEAADTIDALVVALESLLNACKAGADPYNEPGLVSIKRAADALALAKRPGIPVLEIGE